MAEKSNIDKLPVMGVKFWEGIGKLVGGRGGLVDKDCEKGIMQNGTAGHPLSPKYRKYKANDMRRFGDGQRLGAPINITKRGGTKSKKGTTSGELLALQFGGKTRKIQRKRKFPLVGRSLFDIGKPHVTMRLTGDTTLGLRPEKAYDGGVTMAFNPRDTDKIVGNARLGYDIVGLNKVNIELVRQQIIKQFQKNKVKYLNKNIKIGVTKL